MTETETHPDFDPDATPLVFTEYETETGAVAVIEDEAADRAWLRSTVTYDVRP